MTPTEIDARFDKLERENLAHDWQRHRMFCLKLAARLGAHSPEEAIEMAEKLSPYILVGRATREPMG